MAFKDFVKTVKNEAGDAVEITKMKAKISKEKTAIKDAYEELGELLYHQVKDGVACAPEYAVYVDKIDAAKANIKQLNEQIEHVKMN